MHSEPSPRPAVTPGEVYCADHLALVRQRVRGGYYDRGDVIERLALRLAERGLA